MLVLAAKYFEVQGTYVSHHPVEKSIVENISQSAVRRKVAHD